MNKRISQISSVVQKYLSQKILQDIPEDYGLVTVVDVIVAPDLKEAKIYISTIDEPSLEPVLKLLNGKSSEYHWELKKQMTVRYVPNLHFYADNSLEKINKVEKILEEIKNGA
jgi:ribosome-binding factor A